jgi:CRISPR-associated protein Csb3
VAAFHITTPEALTLRECLDALRNSRIDALAHTDPKIAPVVLKGARREWRLTWWLDPTLTDASDLKLWAAHHTGLMLVQGMHQHLPAFEPQPEASLFDARVALSGRLGLDPRSGWVALNCGYSPNEQNQLVFTYPAVELLAAMGLQGFVLSRRARRMYGYHLWRTPLPVVAARAAWSGALGGDDLVACAFPIVARGRFKAFGFAHYVRRDEDGRRPDAV